jgi:hypothetical protein
VKAKVVSNTAAAAAPPPPQKSESARDILNRIEDHWMYIIYIIEIKFYDLNVLVL